MKKDITLRYRASEKDAEIIKAAAAVQEQSMSEWTRDTLVTAAKKVLKKAGIGSA